MIAEARKAGPVLVLDAGNALYEVSAPLSSAPTPHARARAELLARTMAELGTAAMAVGPRDLTAGVDAALKLSRAAHLPMLSVNLRRAGKPVFPASLVVTVGGVRVGLLGVSPAGHLGLETTPDKNVVGELPVALAVAEARALRPRCDLVIALAAISTADALQLSHDAGPALDLILQSSEQRAGLVAASSGGAPVFPGGFEGRDVRLLALRGQGTGPLVNLGERRQLEQRRQVLIDNSARVKERLAATLDPAVRSSLQATLDNFATQLKSAEADLARSNRPDARTVEPSLRVLDQTVASDPALAVRVSKLEPAGEGANPALEPRTGD